jgi:hypothetical protein
MDLELALFVRWEQVRAEDVGDFAGDRIFCSELADRKARNSWFHHIRTGGRHSGMPCTMAQIRFK